GRAAQRRRRGGAAASASRYRARASRPRFCPPAEEQLACVATLVQCHSRRNPNSIVRHHRYELLDPLIFFYLAGIDVPLRVGGNGIDPMELSRIGSIAPESSDCLPGVAVQNPYFVVRSVGDIHVLLLRIARERKLVSRATWRKFLVIQTTTSLAARRRVRRDVEFPHEPSLFREYFDPILSTFPDIDQPFFREFDEVQIGHEVLFFRRRSAGPFVSGDRIIRDFTQRHSMAAPPPLECPRIH